MTNRELAQKIMSEILDKGLSDSTFRDNYPAAYDHLRHYRLDMECDVESVLDKQEPK